MSIEFLPSNRPYKGLFDLLADDDDYVASVLRTMVGVQVFEDWTPIALGWISYNPYGAAQGLGIDVARLRDASAYRCPYLDQTFQSVVPTFILTKDAHAYEPFARHYARDMFKDAEFLRARFSENLNGFEKTMMGPGYTDFFLPSDGSNGREQGHVALSNGDLLVVSVWHWFNK
jgi:hypothetical protein